jgi:hypothetical protein
MESHLFELHITNRSDAHKERAQLFFYCTHQEPTPNLQHGFALEIDQSFLDKIDNVSVTNLRGCKALFITICSSEKTYLHLAAIQVLGLPMMSATQS